MNYLQSDMFLKFNSFFHGDLFEDNRFLFELAKGFMLRKFLKNEIIYD